MCDFRFRHHSLRRSRRMYVRIFPTRADIRSGLIRFAGEICFEVKRTRGTGIDPGGESVHGDL